MLPTSEKIKGINYNITFSENSIEKKAPLNTESVALISYLNEKIRFLESENSQLKKEITFKCKDKEMTEYYLRLRREFFEEAERSKKEQIAREAELNAEIERLKSDNNFLANRLRSI